mgnify:CR=1 FL=1
MHVFTMYVYLGGSRVFFTTLARQYSTRVTVFKNNLPDKILAMRRTYIIAHWALTLLLAPLTSQALEYIVGANPHQVVGLLEVYPITVLFSIAFSIPTFLIYLACFYFLSKQNMNFAVSKFILIAISILGIYITESVIKGSMSRDIIITYSVTSFIVGIVLRLKETKIKTQDNPIAT